MTTRELDEDVWLYQVYGSSVASGNPTGIVLCRDAWSHEEMQRVASRLGYPDTGFVTLAGDSISMLSFSPTEELAFCSQTTLALGAMLVRTGLIGDWHQVQVKCAAGDVTLERAAAAGRFWAHLTIPQDIARVDSSALRNLLRLREVECGPQFVIGFGRRRAYMSVPSASRLYSLAPSPVDVMEYCRSAGVNGICVFVEEAGLIKIRIFTTSLLGAEDASTGGAVAALPLYFEALNEESSEAAWLVDQGSGAPTNRGRLYLRRLKGRGNVAVGGDTAPTSSGRLDVEARREFQDRGL